MGIWSFLSGGNRLVEGNAMPALGSPFAPANSLSDAIVGDILGEIPSEVITENIALRVPEVKRALQAHTSLVAPLKFTVHDNGSDESRASQPAWVTGSAAGVSPYIRWKGVTRDLFLHGWALLGALKGTDDLPTDFLHIPRDYWSVGGNGKISIDEGIPAAYRHPVLIPLGTNGLLLDGIDSIRQARKLELARQARLDAPPAATELHMTNPIYDEMSSVEKEKLARDYAASRGKHSVSVTPSYVEVKSHESAAVDLFESAMNSLRIQIANHAGIPASFIEGGKEGGTAGQMSYSNDSTRQSELWTFGSSEFAYAITARLSMDDVVGPDAEVRADLSSFMNPPATQLAPETAPEEVAA